MNKIKTKNILFISVVLLLILAIGIFNYLTDPYHIFDKNGFMNIYNDIKFERKPPEILNIQIKAYKDKPYDTVVSGGSEISSMYGDIYAAIFFKYYFNQLSLYTPTFRKQYQVLKCYLDLHKETKNVIISLPYPSLLMVDDSELELFENSNFTIKEWALLLFSTETTRLSLKRLYRLIRVKLFQRRINENCILKKFPRGIDKYTINDKSERDNVLERDKLIINDLISLFEERNINYTIIFPPYSGIYLTLFYSNIHCRKIINGVKRYVVENIPQNVQVYDFAFINKYSEQLMEDDKNQYFLNPSHPSFVYGVKLFKVLFDSKNAENDIFIKLNKDNIDETLEYEGQLIESWMKGKKDYIKEYEQLRDSKTDSSPTSANIKKLIPDAQKELDYIIERGMLLRKG